MSPRKPKSQQFKVKVGNHWYPFIYYTTSGKVTAKGILEFTAKSPQDAKEILRRVYTEWEARIGAFSKSE